MIIVSDSKHIDTSPMIDATLTGVNEEECILFLTNIIQAKASGWCCMYSTFLNNLLIYSYVAPLLSAITTRYYVTLYYVSFFVSAHIFHRRVWYRRSGIILIL